MLSDMEAHLPLDGQESNMVASSWPELVCLLNMNGLPPLFKYNPSTALFMYNPSTAPLEYGSAIHEDLWSPS